MTELKYEASQAFWQALPLRHQVAGETALGVNPLATGKIDRNKLNT